MKQKPILAFLFTLATALMQAQQLPVDIGLNLTTGYNSPEVPFWMRSNQFGSLPSSGFSAGLTGSIHKNYSPTPKKFDWGIGAEARFNAGEGSGKSTVEPPSWFTLIEGYGKIKYGIFELMAGRAKDVTGLHDTLLSSGSWSVSGNALGIPKIQLSIPDYYTIPWFDGLFSIKGTYAHGWLESKTYFLQQSLYGRMGKPNWKLNLYGGFNHQAVWGDERNRFNHEDYELNFLQTIYYVNLGKAYNNGEIKATRVGNHLGSIDMALSYDFTGVRLFIYRQFIYDAGALYYLANLRDGLTGLSIANRKDVERNLQWNRFVIEFLYTKNQAGETWSPETTSPYENYYNNSYYPKGWSYMESGIGNPFISNDAYLKDGFPRASGQAFHNNRIALFHAGFDIDLYKWNILCKLSYSKNYGHYLTAKNGKIWDGGINHDEPDGIFPETEQFSGYLSSVRELKKGMHIGIQIALDQGGLYENCAGIMATVGKDGRFGEF